MAVPSISPPSGERRPIDAILAPIQRFLRIEAAAGVLLLVATAAALIWANSAWHDSYHHFWHTPLSVSFGSRTLSMSLAHFVNDGLMAIFFFVVGLEIKRELFAGELSSPRKALVPIAAAIGGMVVPAAIYVGLTVGADGNATRGWAIPTATDIAFAIGIMAMLGSRVPLSLKVFLTALAIIDDIAAVVVIAVFYSSDISLITLAMAFGCLAMSAVANRLGVRTPIFYAIIGIVVWLMLLESGVHATIGGVLLALTIPASMRIRGREFTAFAHDMVDRFESAGGGGDDILTNPKRQSVVKALETACEHVQTPLSRLENGMHPWVAFVIMPIFALANAGVSLSGSVGDALSSGIGLGVALGLLVGKPLGVMAATALVVRLGWGVLPEGTNWRQLFGASCLAGIGFTMSLFIANLAYGETAELTLAKTGILAGSLLAGVLGFASLRVSDAPSSPTRDGTGTEGDRQDSMIP